MKKGETIKDADVFELQQTLWLVERLVRDCRSRVAVIVSQVIDGSYSNRAISTPIISCRKPRRELQSIGLNAARLLECEFEPREFHAVCRSLLPSGQRAGYRVATSRELLRWLEQSAKIERLPVASSSRRKTDLFRLSQGPVGRVRSPSG